MNRTNLFCLIGLFNTAMIVGAHASTAVKIDGGLSSEDNLNYAFSEDQKKSDVQEFINAAATHAWSMSDDGNLALTGNVGFHHFNEYEGLNYIDPSLALSYKNKLGLGPAPWVRGSLSATRLDYRDDVRSGWLYAADLGIDKQLTRQWYASLSWRFEKREADETERYYSRISGAVFDQISNSFTGAMNYWVDNLTALSFGYTWRRGDIAASVEENHALAYKMRAVTEDYVFGDEFYAYKLRATTHMLHVGLSREITPQSLLTLKWQRRMSHGEYDLNYYGNVVSMNFQYRLGE